MAKFGVDAVITDPMQIIWDGITRPETMKNNQPLPKPIYSLKVAGSPQAPWIADINALVQATLIASEFKGVMPHNGDHPVKQCDPTLAEGKLAGLISINAKTRNGAPKVFDMAGALLEPMVYGPMMYPGCLVKLLVTAYPFNKEGNKGVALSLDGIQIVDATAPRLPIGGAGPDAAAAFGGGAVAPVQAATPPVAPVQAPVTPAATPPVTYQTPGVAPAPSFLAPPVPPVAPVAPQRVMLPAAQGATYEAMCAAGWTDALLVQHGMMAP
jgi:hypothetical protein